MCVRVRLSSDVSEIKLVFSTAAAQADPELRAELECRATERIRAAHYRTPTQCSDETPRAALMLATGMMAERAVRTQQPMAAVLKQGVGFR